LPRSKASQVLHHWLEQCPQCEAAIDVALRHAAVEERSDEAYEEPIERAIQAARREELQERRRRLAVADGVGKLRQGADPCFESPSVRERIEIDLAHGKELRHTAPKAMLERIERAGLFLLPLDEVRGWWRYHRLFSGLLQARLAAGQPERVPALHRAAAAWYAERGLADDAVRHALAAGEPAQAAELVERHFDAVYFTGENATVRRWLSALLGGVRARRKGRHDGRTIAGHRKNSFARAEIQGDARDGDAGRQF